MKVSFSIIIYNNEGFKTTAKTQKLIKSMPSEEQVGLSPAMHIIPHHAMKIIHPS